MITIGMRLSRLGWTWFGAVLMIVGLGVAVYMGSALQGPHPFSGTSPSMSSLSIGNGTVSEIPLVEMNVPSAIGKGHELPKVELLHVEALFAELEAIDDGAELEKKLENALVHLPEKDYALALDFFLREDVSDSLKSVIFNDVASRSIYLRLPWMLEVSQLGGNHFAEDARNYLAAELEMDFGSNWHGWKEAVDAKLLGQDPEYYFE